LGLRAERIPIKWTHLIGKESLNTEKLEHSLISPEIVRAILAGPDQDRTARAILDQRDPAQDERAHDPLAEFSFRDDDAAQALGGNEKRFDLGLCTRVNERGAARQLSDFGEELARSFFDDWDHMSQTVPGADGNRACDEHEHARARFAGHE
jgi:hypothetical protein